MKNRANLLFIFSTLFVVLCLFKEKIWSAEEKKREGKRGKYLEKENICPQRRRRTEKKKKENICERKIFSPQRR